MRTTTYVRYELRRSFRNRRFFLFTLGFPLALYLLIATPNRHEASLAGSGISAPLYFMVGLAALGAMNAVVGAGGRIALERFLGWTRQLRLTPLSARVYFGTKVASAYATALLTIAALYAAGISLGVSTALNEVRDTVQGYRRLALAEALQTAEAALTSAGIDCELAEADVTLPADVDAVLAWAVREGTTNVIRHSGALHCTIRVRADGEQAAVEIEDDGEVSASAGAGSGLAGLRERAQRLRGELEAGAGPDGGFLLRLTVPLAGT
jgi:anti-sigma regulatory factor (Ser/Thr protein kinase)